MAGERVGCEDVGWEGVVPAEVAASAGVAALVVGADVPATGPQGQGQGRSAGEHDNGGRAGKSHEARR